MGSPKSLPIRKIITLSLLSTLLFFSISPSPLPKFSHPPPLATLPQNSPPPSISLSSPPPDCCPKPPSSQPPPPPPPPPPASLRSSIDPFQSWAERYLSASPATRLTLIPEGQALAAKRHDAFASLIRSHPEAAIESLLPFALRQALPTSITDLLEYRVSGRGDLLVVAVRPLPGETLDEPIYRTATLNGQEFRVYTFGRRLADISRFATPIHGVAIRQPDGTALLAVRDQGYAILDPDEAATLRPPSIPTLCPISGIATQPTAVALDTGNKLVWLCSHGHIESWLQTPDGKLVEAAGGSGNSGGLSPVVPATWTQGNKKFLAIRVRFADQAVGFQPTPDATIQAELQKVVNVLPTWSYGKTQGSFAFTPTLDLPGTEASYSTLGMGFLGVARTLAAAYTDSSGAHPYDTANFDFDAVVFSASWGSYCGVAFVGAKGTMIKCSSAGVYLHEWGHNFGLNHANFLTPLTDSPIGPGTHVEYGSKYSVMGNASVTAYNTLERSTLRWLESSDLLEISASGTYKLYNADKSSLTADHPYAFRIRKDDRLYYLEYRPNWNGTTHEFSTDYGAMLLWTQSQQLLDMTPFSTAGNADASLLIGRSFHDPDQGITVTPIAHGGTAPDDYLTLVVNFTNPTSNSPPVAILTASHLTPPTSTAVALTAIASDPDGDPLAFSWDYGDGLSASVNNSPTQTKSWTTAGDYTVRCTVSDMKGKSSIQKIVIHVGSPSTFTISGRVTQPDGSPVSGVFIRDASTHFTSTDADGCYSLGPLAATSATLTAIKNGWTFSTQFFNPVLIGPSASNINFTATAPPDTGSITLEHWDGIAGSSVANLTSNPAYPNSPSYSYNLTSLFEAGTNTGSNYGQRVRGYFRPPLTGNYTFYIASDDHSELWLSSTDSPTTKTKIASITGYTSVREWTKYSSQKSAPILLSAGSRYYIEALHKENSGSDHLSVGVDFPDSSTHRPLESLYLGPASSLPIPTPPSQISVVASTPSTTEGSLTPAIFTLTRSGPTTSPLTVFFTLTGTATYGSDFSPTTLSTTFAIGESTLTVPIASIDDSTPEPDETVVLTLSPSIAYTIIAPTTATATIHDNEPVQVSTTATDPTATEAGSDLGSFTISRTGSTANPLTVPLNATGTATPAIDYQSLPTTAVIPAGQSTITLTVIPIADSLAEPDETIILTVSSSPNYTLTSPTATVRILAQSPILNWLNPTSGNWSASTNWASDSPISSGLPSYVLNFNIPGTFTATADLDPNFQLNQLNFGGSTASISGKTLAFTPLGTALPQCNQISSTPISISNNLSLSAALTFGGSGLGSLTLSGSLSGAGGLVKSSPGNLTLTATNNTYSGTTVLTAGSLALSNSSSLTASGITTINGSSTLQINAGSTLADLQTYLGDTSNNNSLLITGANARLLRGAFPGSGTHRLYLGMQSSGANGGTGNSLTVSAGGYLYSGGGSSDRSLLNSNNNSVTITGPNSQWFVTSSDLRLGSTSNSSNNSVTIQDGALLNINATQAVIIGSTANSNNNSITVTGASSLWNLNSSSLAVGFSSSSANSANILNSATLSYSTPTPSVTVLPGNAINFTNATLAYQNVSSTNLNLLEGNTFPTGVGLFTWSGSNTFRLSSSSESGGANYTFANHLGPKNFASLEIYGSSSLARPITLDATHGASLLLNSATATLPAGITLLGPVPITTNGSPSTLNAVLSGSGSLSKLGPSSLTLTALNTFTGNLFVPSGSLILADRAGLSFRITDSSANTITGSGAFTAQGSFSLDTSAVTLPNHSWILVNLPSFSFTETFTVAGTGWTKSNGLWSKSANLQTWTFNPSTATLTVTTTPAPSPIDLWRSLHFGSPSSNPLISADSADPDGDLLANLLEYALGWDPQTKNLPPLPVIESNYLTLSFTRSKSATDITLRVLSSTSLSSWSTTGVIEEILSETPTTQSVKAKVLLAPDSKKFLRLEVSYP